jgi:ferredoxin
MRIAIDDNKCFGHGRCYDLAPDLVGIDDEGRGEADDVEVPAELEASALDAAGSCPEGAVVLSS